MIDEDDVTWTAVLWSDGMGWFSALVGLVVVVVLLFVFLGNKKECEAKACDGGKKPVLMEHECLCVEPAR